MKKIAFCIYNDMELLDFSGPHSAFYTANQLVPGSYELVTVSLDEQTLCSTESGVGLTAQLSIDELEQCHTLLIPGGKGARLSAINPQSLRAINKIATSCERMVSICTGAFILARVGLMPGTKLTSHWAFSQSLAKDFPDLNIDHDSLFIQDGRYWSSAGVTAGIDLTLHLIELDLGKPVAMQVAKQLLVYLKRAGSQQQFSTTLQLQSQCSSQLASILALIHQQYPSTLSVDILATHANLSLRQFHRVFQQETGMTPAAYVERVRLDQARELLVTSDLALKAIALNVGYQSYDGFMRAFVRLFNIPPGQYRQQFSQH